MNPTFTAEFDPKYGSWIIKEMKGFKTIVINRREIGNANSFNLTVILQ